MEAGRARIRADRSHRAGARAGANALTKGEPAPSSVSIAISSRCAAASTLFALKKSAPVPARPALRRRDPALKRRDGHPTKLRYLRGWLRLKLRSRGCRKVMARPVVVRVRGRGDQCASAVR